MVNKKNLDEVDVIVTRSHRPSTMGYELPRIVQAVANKWGKSNGNATAFACAFTREGYRRNRKAIARDHARVAVIRLFFV